MKGTKENIWQIKYNHVYLKNSKGDGEGNVLNAPKHAT